MLVELAASPHGVPIPSFVQLAPDAARYWPVFTSARVAQDWRDLDLRLVGTVCTLEAQISEYRRMLTETGPIVMTSKGPRANPLIAIIDTCLREQLAILRMLALSVPSGIASAKHGLKAKQLRTIGETDDGLLAKPY